MSIPSSSDPALTRTFRRAAAFIPTGVAILSTESTTMTVSSLHCVSLDPPMVSVALAKDSARGTAILNSGWFRVRLLRAGEETSAKGEGIPSSPGIVEMTCTVTATIPAGDHNLVLALVSATSISDGFPLVYWKRGLHAFQPRYDFLDTRQAFADFVAAWEAGTLPKAQWTHAAHVAVSAAYTVRFGGGAFERVKDGIRRYNEAVGTADNDHSGYHETLTRLWSMVVARVVGSGSDPWEAACKAVHQLGEDRELHRLYYSFDVVRSVEPRRTWVPPDLEGPY
jgi:flavin reductase (DIM6/NTAB) family NADH-FMN oxidoreductase RutF